MEKIVISGIPIHLFTVESLHNTIKHTIEGKRKNVFLHANARLIELASTKGPWLVEFFNRRTNYVMCDGAGVQLAAKLTKQTVPLKIPYNTWFWEFMEFVVAHKYSIYFLGAAPETITKAVENVRKFKSSINIAGYHHGYFNKEINSSENRHIIETISVLKPNILLVGFGMPIQEKWVKENYDSLHCHAIFTCGGAFDFISGKNRVAPYFFRKFYLEWVFRFFLEPARLFSRVTSSNLTFLKLALMLRRAQRKGSKGN